MNLAIVGSRTFNDYELLRRMMAYHFTMYLEELALVFISGGAQGADSLAEKYATAFSIPKEIYLAEWDKYGKSAGFIRNQTIVDNCDMVLAFWDGESRGTADTIAKAKKARKPTFIIYF